MRIVQHRKGGNGYIYPHRQADASRRYGTSQCVQQEQGIENEIDGESGVDDVQRRPGGRYTIDEVEAADSKQKKQVATYRVKFQLDTPNFMY